MLLFIVGIVLATCSGMAFVDRNNTHQLFEYTFSQAECENGYFTPRTFNNGSSLKSINRTIPPSFLGGIFFGAWEYVNLDAAYKQSIYQAPVYLLLR